MSGSLSRARGRPGRGRSSRAVPDDGLEVLLPHDPVLHRVLDHGAEQAGGDVGGAAPRRRRSGRPARRRWSSPRSPRRSTGSRTGDLSVVRRSAVTPERSSRKIVTTRSISDSDSRSAGQLQRLRPSAVDAGADDLDLLLEGVRQRQHDGVEPAAQRRGQVVDALVAVVRGGDDVEAGLRLHLGVELGDRQVFSDRIVMRASCTSAGIRVSSSTRTMAPVSIARITGLGTSACAAGPVGEQPGVVPAVAQRLLRRARRALHHQRRRAADRRPRGARPPRSSPCRARRAAAAPGRWPGWPRRSRSSRREPRYFGLIDRAVGERRRRAGTSRPPTATAASCGGRGRSSAAARAASSSAYCCSAWARSTSGRDVGHRKASLIDRCRDWNWRTSRRVVRRKVSSPAACMAFSTAGRVLGCRAVGRTSRRARTA